MLTEVLKRLTGLPYKEDYKLKGGLTLCWRPPNILIITRPDTPPSPQELWTVEDHLSRLGWLSFAGKLRSKPGKGGKTWYYWKLSLNRTRPLV